jgi:hypothetical protein
MSAAMVRGWIVSSDPSSSTIRTMSVCSKVGSAIPATWTGLVRREPGPGSRISIASSGSVGIEVARGTVALAGGGGDVGESEGVGLCSPGEGKLQAARRTSRVQVVIFAIFIWISPVGGECNRD